MSSTFARGRSLRSQHPQADHREAPRIGLRSVWAAVVGLLVSAVLVAVPTAASAAAAMTVGVTEIPVSTVVDLTNEGTTDWASWVCGNTENGGACQGHLPADASPYARKDVTPLIGEVLLDATLDAGGVAALRSLAQPRLRTTWSDGDPAITWSGDGAAHPAGARTVGLLQWCGACGNGASPGAGTSFTFPVTAATTGENALHLYVGGFRAEGTLTVTLPGVPDVVLTHDFGQGVATLDVAITFTAASVGDELLATWKETVSNGGSSNLHIMAATLSSSPPPVVDTDGDGVPDEDDAFPSSDLGPTVMIDGCDSGVANNLFADGATFNDLIAQAAAEATNHGKFVRAVSRLSNDWKKAGLISGREKGAITSCAARSDLP